MPSDSSPANREVRDPLERPLEGVRVVVTRAEHQSVGLGRLLEDAGAVVSYVPTIAITDPDSWHDVDMAIRKLAEGLYAWVIFTSQNAIDRFFSRIDATGLDVRAFARTRVAAVGSSSAALLRQHGIKADFVPESFTAASVAEGIGRGSGRVLLPRAAHAPREIVEVLESAGWIPEEVATYVTVPANADTPEARAVKAGEFDVLTLTSGSTAHRFAQLIAQPAAVGLGPGDDGARRVACIGPQTAEAARRAGFRPDIVAEDHTIEGLVAALVDARGEEEEPMRSDPGDN